MRLEIVAGEVKAAGSTNPSIISRADPTRKARLLLPSPELISKQHVGGASHTALRSTGRTLLDLRSFIPEYNLAGVHAKVAELARKPGVSVETLAEVGGHPIQALHIPARQSPAKLRVMITAGLHGIESAGPAGAIAFAERWLSSLDRELRKHVSVTIVPVVNPVGYTRRKRKNGDGLDLNRCFGMGADAPIEVRAIQALAARGKFDMAIDLHSAWSIGDSGFFAIHHGGRDVLDPAVAKFKRSHPLLSEGTDVYAMDAPGIFTTQNKGTLQRYMHQLGVPYSFTVEAAAQSEYTLQSGGLADFARALIVEGARVRSAMGSLNS